MFKIPTFEIPTFIIPMEKNVHNTNGAFKIPMALSKYQWRVQNTNDTRSKYQWKVHNTNKLKSVRFINSKYQQVGILNTVHNTNPSPQNYHLGTRWAPTSSQLAGRPDGPPDKYPNRPLQRLCSYQSKSRGPNTFNPCSFHMHKMPFHKMHRLPPSRCDHKS